MTAAGPGRVQISFPLPPVARLTHEAVVENLTALGFVRVLVDGTVPAGLHRARWDGRDATGRASSAGIYFVKLRAGGAESAQRLLRLR